MAKVTTQSIPSELRTLYKRACQIDTTSKGTHYIRSRYPWRVPHMQAGGADVSPAQLVQRNRFIYAKNKYAELDATARARWVAANPEYHSYLFGYNFFMLEGLMGGGTMEYPQMIKSIQVIKEEVPTTGTKSFTLSPEVDPTKCVVMIQGSARKVPKVLRGAGAVAAAGAVLNIGDTVDPDKCSVLLQGGSWHEIGEAVAVPIAPYLSDISITTVTIDWPVAVNATADVGFEVTEHVEGAVYPVQVSIAAAAVVIDWAEVPDSAADVSITVVEYL